MLLTELGMEVTGVNDPEGVTRRHRGIADKVLCGVAVGDGGEGFLCQFREGVK